MNTVSSNSIWLPYTNNTDDIFLTGFLAFQKDIPIDASASAVEIKKACISCCRNMGIRILEPHDTFLSGMLKDKRSASGILGTSASSIVCGVRMDQVPDDSSEWKFIVIVLGIYRQFTHLSRDFAVAERVLSFFFLSNKPQPIRSVSQQGTPSSSVLLDLIDWSSTSSSSSDNLGKPKFDSVSMALENQLTSSLFISTSDVIHHSTNSILASSCICSRIAAKSGGQGDDDDGGGANASIALDQQYMTCIRSRIIEATFSVVNQTWDPLFQSVNDLVLECRNLASLLYPIYDGLGLNVSILSSDCDMLALQTHEISQDVIPRLFSSASEQGSEIGIAIPSSSSSDILYTLAVSDNSGNWTLTSRASQLSNVPVNAWKCLAMSLSCHVLVSRLVCKVQSTLRREFELGQTSKLALIRCRQEMVERIIDHVLKCNSKDASIGFSSGYQSLVNLLKADFPILENSSKETLLAHIDDCWKGPRPGRLYITRSAIWFASSMISEYRDVISLHSVTGCTTVESLIGSGTNLEIDALGNEEKVFRFSKLKKSNVDGIAVLITALKEVKMKEARREEAES